MQDPAPVIELDKRRTLRYTMRSLVLTVKGSGCEIGELLITRAGVASAAWLIWGALIHEDAAFQKRQAPELLIEDVCDWLDEHWLGKGRTIKELEPLYSAAIQAAGLFEKAPAGKAVPEAALEPAASGSSTGSPT